MPSSRYISEQAPGPAIDPLAPAEQLGHWLLTTTTHVALGLVIGFVLARQMRAMHLRWTWAAVALGVVLIARPLFGHYALTSASAAFCAAVRGRRWHREDIQAGADLAEIAGQRRGPLDALRSVLHAIERRPNSRPLVGHVAMLEWLRNLRGPDRGGLGLRDRPGAGDVLGVDGLGDERLDAGHALRDGRLIVGHEPGGQAVSIPFAGSRGGRHTLVVGATGSGKTVTATWIATQAVQAGMSVIVVDPKGDRRMREELAHAAHTRARSMIRWTPDGPSVYNPFARGTDSEIADKALAGERFTEPHYLRQAQRFLGHEVRALRAAGLEVSLGTLVEYLAPARLELLARSLPEPLAGTTHRYLDALTSRQQSDLSGVRDRLSILAESDFAAWLDPDTGAGSSFDLLQAIRSRAIVYFDLQSDSRPLLAQMLGVAIVIDLQTAVATLQRTPTAALVVIDEFSAIAAEQVTRLFGRARAAGVSLLLGTQELSDLRLAGRETVLEQVLGNLSSLIAHRQVVPDSGELVSRLAGSHGVWRTSQGSDGRWTRTRVSAPLLAAESVRGLPDGCAAVIDLGGDKSVCVARMLCAGASLPARALWIAGKRMRARGAIARALASRR